MNKDDFATLNAWLAEQWKEEGFVLFFERIKEQRNGCVVAALSQGDTDFEKGQVEALQWVLDQPADLLKTGTGADT